MTHTTTATVSGVTVVAVSTLSPVCQECVERIYAHSRTDRADERTAADWQQAQDMAAERNQAADDRLLYNTQERPDDRGVGYT